MKSKFKNEYFGICILYGVTANNIGDVSYTQKGNNQYDKKNNFSDNFGGDLSEPCVLRMQYGRHGR